MRGLFENWRRRRKSDVAPCPKSAPDSDSRYLFGGDFGGATEAVKGSRGSDPRLLGLTMGWLLDRTLGSDPVHQGSSMPEGQTNPQLDNNIPQQVRQIETARSLPILRNAMPLLSDA